MILDMGMVHAVIDKENVNSRVSAVPPFVAILSIERVMKLEAVVRIAAWVTR